MAIRSGFFNSVNGDRKYDASRFAEYFASFIGNGVFPNPSDGLQVMANDDMTVTVKAGKCWINGYIMINDDDYILEIEPADGVLNRIDRVVARYDVVDREIRLEVKKGTFASNPVAPNLQRDADAYELALADVYIAAGAVSITQANITDLRLNSELCGIVHGTVEQVDTTTLFAQYQAWYQQTTGQAETDIEAIKQQFQDDINQFLQNWHDWFINITGEKEEEFDTWFDGIKEILNESTAGNLLNLIENHKDDKNNPHNVSVEQIGAETPAGSQEKANAALAAAKSYTDQEVNEVASELESHKNEKASLTKLGHVKAETDEEGRLILDIPKSNYNADRPPNENDDETQGYSAGSMWFVNDGSRKTGYICIDATSSFAIWQLIGSKSHIRYYSAGNEYTNTTGGWVKGFENNVYINEDHPPTSKESDHLYISGYGVTGDPESSFVTNQKVNLSDIDYLYISWEGISTSSFGRAILLVSNQKNVSVYEDLGLAYIVYRGPSNRGFPTTTTKLDVRGLSGDYYIRVVAANSGTARNTKIKVYGVWGGAFEDE